MRQAGLLFLACLACLASAADTTTSSSANVTLAPVTASPSPDGSSALRPSVNMSLPYGNGGGGGSDDETAAGPVLLDVGLTTSHASVLLETIASVVAVDCSAAGGSVRVTFDNADDLASAYAEWSGLPFLVLVTNHLGDCDSELERGFFTADGFAADAATLTLVATTQKSTISDIGSYLRTNFSGLPLVSAKRTLGSITYSPDPINFATDLVLNETVLFEVDDFSATVDSGSLEISVTVGGSLTYNILTSTLVELEVYLETNTSSALVFDLSLAAAYNGTFAHTADTETYVVDVPGLLAFGPRVSFEIGAAVAAAAGVDVVLQLASAVDNGTFVLDYTPQGDAANLSYAGDNWAPTFDVSVSISEAAAVAVTPYVTSTFALDFALLGGVYNVSGGIAPSSRFPTEVALAAEQGAGRRSESATGGSASAAAAGCDDGVSVDSDFEFSLVAFVTGSWEKEYLYNKSVSVLDSCLSF